MDDAILSNLEAQIVDENPSAERPGGQVPENVAMVETSLELQGEKGGSAAMDEALSHLPPAIALRIATVAARYGIRENNDPFWGVVEVMQNSFECAKASGSAAAAAGASAEELSKHLDKLPATMQDALFSASKSFDKQVQAILVKDGGTFIDAIKSLITKSADAGAEKLKGAAETLDSELTRKIEVRKTEGVQEWGIQAANAALIAARTAQGAVVRHSAALVIGVLLIGVLLGGAGLWGLRVITGDYLPAGVKTFQSPTSGYFIRVDPAVVTLENGKRCGSDICVPVLPK
jgi:HPt (histidine-containing phosphotransfer) domain-containing protein